MSSPFKSIQRGLQETIAYAQGSQEGTRTHLAAKVDVKAIRKKANMTQKEFASTFRISLGTLRHWERGDRIPRGPALVLLNIIDTAPQSILDIIHHKKVA